MKRLKWLNSLDAIKSTLLQDIESSLETIKIKNIEDSMINAIQSVVYDTYTPSEYQRRHNRPNGGGGLSDKKNIVSESKINGANEVEIVIRNIAKGDEQTSIEIDKIIVEGVGYTWTESRIYKQQPFPRDFYAETKREVEKYLIQRIKEELKQRGW